MTPEQIVERGRRVVRLAREALATVEERLGAPFAAAVTMIAESSGRVIVAGAHLDVTDFRAPTLAADLARLVLAQLVARGVPLHPPILYLARHPCSSRVAPPTFTSVLATHLRTLDALIVIDSPEFTPFHDKGNSTSIFDHIDYQPNGHDSLHLNIFGARNWFQIPNTYDQLNQDQRQRATTFSLAPGYQHTFGASSLFTIDPFFRQDRVDYWPSRDPFDDTPATVAQNRHLTFCPADARQPGLGKRHVLDIVAISHQHPALN